MTYRIATVNDVEAINKLCDEEGLDHPTLQLCMVAEEDGKIIGYINAVTVPILDMVCNNPYAGKTLFDKFSGYLLGSNYSSMMLFTKKENVETLATKYNFKKIKDFVNLYLREI